MHLNRRNLAGRPSLAPYANLFGFCSVLALSFGLVPQIALAQESQANSNPSEPGGIISGTRFVTATRGAIAKLDGTEDGTRLEIGYGANLLIAPPNVGERQVSQDSLEFKLSVDVPVGGEQDLLDDPSLDVLGGGVKFKAGISWTQANIGLDRLQTADGFSAVADKAMTECLTDKSQSVCNQEKNQNALDFIKRNNPLGLRDFIDKHGRAAPGDYWIVGLTGSIGIQDFDYTLPGSFTDLDERRESWAIGLSGTYFINPRQSVIAELEYGDGWSAPDSEIVCRTLVSDPKEDCKQAAPGAPTREDSLVMQAGYNYDRLFALGPKGVRLGLGLTGSFDLLNDDYGVELPLTFGIGEEPSVVPGITLGYTRDASKPADNDEAISLKFVLKASFG